MMEKQGEDKVTHQDLGTQDLELRSLFSAHLVVGG